MNNKVQDFLGLSALLNGNKAERPGKHLQRTADISLATPDSTLRVGAWGGSKPLEPRNKV